MSVAIPFSDTFILCFFYIDKDCSYKKVCVNMFVPSIISCLCWISSWRGGRSVTVLWWKLCHVVLECLWASAFVTPNSGRKLFTFVSPLTPKRLVWRLKDKHVTSFSWFFIEGRRGGGGGGGGSGSFGGGGNLGGGGSGCFSSWLFLTDSWRRDSPTFQTLDGQHTTAIRPEHLHVGQPAWDAWVHRQFD